MRQPESSGTSFVIERSHPALPGHFPGLPVVPGVVLIDRVVDAAEQWLKAMVRVRSIRQVKFLQPLLPGETAEVIFNFDGLDTLEFRIERATIPIARGILGIRVGQQR